MTESLSRLIEPISQGWVSEALGGAMLRETTDVGDPVAAGVSMHR